jgi:hypothetical protein
MLIINASVDISCSTGTIDVFAGRAAGTVSVSHDIDPAIDLELFEHFAAR